MLEQRCSSKFAKFPGVSNLFKKPEMSRSKQVERMYGCLSEMLRCVTEATYLLKKDTTAALDTEEFHTRLARQIPDILILALALQVHNAGARTQELPELLDKTVDIQVWADKVLTEPARDLLRFRCDYAKIEIEMAKLLRSDPAGRPVCELESKLEALVKNLRTVDIRKRDEAAMDRKERSLAAKGIENIRRQLKDLEIRSEPLSRKQKEKMKDFTADKSSKEVAIANFKLKLYHYIKKVVLDIVGHSGDSCLSCSEEERIFGILNMIVRKEANVYEKSSESWTDFKLTASIKDNVGSYVRSKF